VKVFCVATVGRQMEGEMITIRFEKAFTQASKADEYAKTLSQSYTEMIDTPHGSVQFVCQRSVHEVEVEE